MSRPDLQPGYEGWQALDPTPQEKSEGGWAWPLPQAGRARLGEDSPTVARPVLTPFWLIPETTDQSSRVCVGGGGGSPMTAYVICTRFGKQRWQKSPKKETG